MSESPPGNRLKGGFNWTSRLWAAFQQVTASGIIVLLAVLLTMNVLAIFLRYRYHKKLQATGCRCREGHGKYEEVRRAWLLCLIAVL
jgi:TRAP-type mannitol/chloroaromatic compound transport system permease large subunit